ncbi:MAG: holo-ACP synthase [bacterium]|nr:holo-ACP synthase [bacterium]
MTAIKGVGIDIIEIERFRSVLKKKNDHFFKKMFSNAEREYCLSYADPAPHFAGTFAGKEAASKALGPEKFPVLSLEIRRSRNGKPEVWRRNKKIAVHLSISHTDHIAISMALR